MSIYETVCVRVCVFGCEFAKVFSEITQNGDLFNELSGS